jgi:hypothetical protein
MNAKRRVGRPQLPPEQRRETVRTRVEPKKIASISLYAATRGISVGQLIDEYVGRQIGERAS